MQQGWVLVEEHAERQKKVLGEAAAAKAAAVGRRCAQPPCLLRPTAQGTSGSVQGAHPPTLRRTITDSAPTGAHGDRLKTVTVGGRTTLPSSAPRSKRCRD